MDKDLWNDIYYLQQQKLKDFVESYAPEEEIKSKNFAALLETTDEYIEYVASFKTFDELLKSSSCSKLIKLAEKHYENCKKLAENHGLTCGERKQELQNSIIDQTEKCSKAFKRYWGFLNDEDYIKFEEIESNIEQFIKMYEELFDLEPETPKKLGCLFRLTKTAYRLIWTMENNPSDKEILYFGNPLLKEYIEFIDGEIAKLRQE